MKTKLENNNHRLLGKKIYRNLFTSESVGAGHPDKICDQISDAILDECLKQDIDSRTAVEVMATNRLIVVAGEIKTKANVDYQQKVWEILKPLGYKESDFVVEIVINKQSSEINNAVDKKNGHLGASDQGIKFGYASNETPEFMPLPIVLAHALVKRAEKLRISKKFQWAKADMKSQVTIDYDHEKPRIHTIVMSIQHEKDFNKKSFEEFIKNEIMDVIAKQYHLNTDFKFFINPSGNFIIGGPVADTGLTGRKIIVDTYGGKGRHGGGAFSGKDYTKVDRSGAYVARWIAKNIVAAKLADVVEIQLSYAIGVENPISISIETFGSEKVEKNKIIKSVNEIFDLSVMGIIKSLNLKRPIYLQVATFGHFGRDDLDLPWEKLNKVKLLQKMTK